MREIRRWANWTLVCAVFLWYPVTTAFVLHTQFVTPALGQVAVAICVAGAVAATMCGAAALVRGPSHRRLVGAAMICALVAVYDEGRRVIANWGSEWIFVAFAGACVPLVFKEIRAGVWSVLEWSMPPIACAVVIAQVVGGSVTLHNANRMVSQVPAEAYREVTSLTDRARRSPSIDIYQLVLDGFGSEDVLQREYDVDIGSDVRSLESHGFRVYPDAVANYAQTFLSLASIWNAAYLDPVTDRLGAAYTRQPMRRLIEESAVFRVMGELGYSRRLIGSGEPTTTGVSALDLCDCSHLEFGAFEASVLYRTPFRFIVPYELQHQAHRQRIRESLAKIAEPGDGDARRFVVAHFMMPHPPFVFGTAGQEVTPERDYDLGDGTLWQGTEEEYIRGYREQARFILARVVDLVPKLIRNSQANGNDALVILHGDHGPRRRFSATDASETDSEEVMPVFLAIRWPKGTEGDVTQIKSLVNVYRAVLRVQFGMRTPDLENRSFISSFLHPYSLREVKVRRAVVLPAPRRQQNNGS